MPFQGRFEGMQTVTPAPPFAYVETSAGGTATHLGRFAGATGSFTIEGVFVPAAGTTRGTFEGTVSTQGAGRP